MRGLYSLAFEAACTTPPATLFQSAVQLPPSPDSLFPFRPIAALAHWPFLPGVHPGSLPGRSSILQGPLQVCCPTLRCALLLAHTGAQSVAPWREPCVLLTGDSAAFASFSCARTCHAVSHVMGTYNVGCMASILKAKEHRKNFKTDF